MAERNVQAAVLRAIGAHPDIRLFRNTVGEGWMGKAVVRNGAAIIQHARHVTFGLVPGSSDLIGWRSVVVTPDMVGRRIAIFLAPECKPETGGRWEPSQRIFAAAVDSAGGIYGIVRSEDDIRRLVDLE